MQTISANETCHTPQNVVSCRKINIWCLFCIVIVLIWIFFSHQRAGGYQKDLVWSQVLVTNTWIETTQMFGSFPLYEHSLSYSLYWLQMFGFNYNTHVWRPCVPMYVNRWDNYQRGGDVFCFFSPSSSSQIKILQFIQLLTNKSDDESHHR